MHRMPLPLGLLVLALAGCIGQPNRADSGANAAPSASPDVNVASGAPVASSVATPSIQPSVPSSTPRPTVVRSAPSSSSVAAQSSRGCPGEPMTVDALLAADRACFGGRDVRVVGRVAPGDGHGGLASSVDPFWLVALPDGPDLWPSKACVNQGCDLLVVFFSPNGPRLDATPHQAEVTGHFDDPAAFTCRGVPTTDNYVPTTEEAVDLCRRAFVLVSERVLSE